MVRRRIHLMVISSVYVNDPKQTRDTQDQVRAFIIVISKLGNFTVVRIMSYFVKGIDSSSLLVNHCGIFFLVLEFGTSIA